MKKLLYKVLEREFSFYKTLNATAIKQIKDTVKRELGYHLTDEEIMLYFIYCKIDEPKENLQIE